MAHILEIKNMEYHYPNKKLFSNLNLSIEEGTFTTIIGNNKSGKTTLIKLICGLFDNKDTIISGYSYVESTKIRDNSKFFGVVLSDIDNKFLFADVYKELAFPLENLNYSIDEIEKRILSFAKKFGVTKLLDAKVEDLTNAEKQELLIMISLLHEPKVLLLDNCFSMINKKTKKKIMNILKKYIQENSLTVILTTTNLEEIIESDYTYVLHNGNIIMEGIPSAVLREEKILTQSGLEIPFMIDLSLKLEFYELLESEITDMDRMVDTLWK